MRNLSIKILIAISTLSFAVAAKAGTVAEDTISMLQTMRAVYGAEYAPADWKAKYINWNLNTEVDKAISAAQARPDLTLQDSRDILKNFVYSMHDYHVSIRFNSTESASLPIKIAGTESQEFIVEIDRTKLSTTAFPFNVGDELVTVDGVAASEAVKAVAAEFTANIPGTDRKVAESRMFARKAERGLRVPQGPITLGIRKQGETQVREVQLIWDYKRERINPRSTFSGTPLKLITPPKMIGGDFVVGQDAASAWDLGARKTFTPDLGTKIWESADTNNFYAYIYQNSDRKLIGYVRIPQYEVEGDNYKKAVADFKEIIGRFEKTTDAMVIDQVNNPGGSVFYLYALASMLSEKPLVTPRHFMAIDQGRLKECLDIADQLAPFQTEDDLQKAIGDQDLTNGYPVTLQFVNFLRSFTSFLVDQWNLGKKLSSPYWIDGVDHINPAEVHYTKPILLLVNELDFSGGDFFPTILQDNQRVKVMGARTAGAGGYVIDQTIQNNLGVQAFRVTESLAERVSGNPIENLGVTPDISYSMTAEDFQSNFAPYVKAVQSAVTELAK